MRKVHFEKVHCIYKGKNWEGLYGMLLAFSKEASGVAAGKPIWAASEAIEIMS